MSIKLSEFKTYDGTERTSIGANSLDTSAGQYFVTKTGEVGDKATAGSVIDGVSLTQAIYASDNQTVAKKAFNFIPNDVDNLYDVTISTGTITIADEGKFYDLQSADVVDGSSESTTTGQLKLIKFISATNSRFQIANA